MKRIFYIVASASMVPTCFWLSGFDFDTRGATACICFLITAFVAWSVWIVEILKLELTND